MAKKTATKKTVTKKTTRKRKDSAQPALPESAPAAAAKPAAPPPTEGDVIWAEIRSLPIDMFSLPNQRVEDHVSRRAGVPDACLLVLKSSAALPSLEATLNVREQVVEIRTQEGDPIRKTYPKYTMEETEGYVLIRRFVPLERKPELQPLRNFVISK